MSGFLGFRSARTFVPLLLGFLLMAVILVVPSFVRISRIYLQTSGGPVVLAYKMQLSDSAGTLARFEAIKNSVEQAMRAGRAA